MQIVQWRNEGRAYGNCLHFQIHNHIQDVLTSWKSNRSTLTENRLIFGQRYTAAHKTTVHSLPVTLLQTSDVKQGQNLEAEAEAKANFWRLRPRLRPKIIMKKVPNND